MYLQEKLGDKVVIEIFGYKINLVVQIIAFVALVLVFISYFSKNRNKFLIIQVIANFIYAVSFFVNDNIAIAIGLLIAGVRCVIYFIFEKKKRTIPIYVAAVFVVATIVVGSIFWEGWLDILPIIALSLFAYLFALNNMQKMRLLLLIPISMFIAVNIINLAIVGAALSLMEFIVVLLSFVKYRKAEEKDKSEKLSIDAENTGRTQNVV